MSQYEDRLKKAAAESAAALVEDGMIVGLGTGSTAAFVLSALGSRVKAGLRIVGVPTSERTAAEARTLGIPLTDLGAESTIDLTIDGADEVEQGTLNLIKGHGGALLREKIVASASKRLVIVVHESKLVPRLGTTQSIPVEVVPFGWQATARRLSEMGAQPVLRKDPKGVTFVSDSGHYIVDCAFPPIADAASVALELDHVVGLVEHGLFIGFTSEVRVGTADGVRILTKNT
jgi:ribose 5-phosphate isomerase A